MPNFVWYPAKCRSLGQYCAVVQQQDRRAVVAYRGLITVGNLLQELHYVMVIKLSLYAVGVCDTVITKGQVSTDASFQWQATEDHKRW